MLLPPYKAADTPFHILGAMELSVDAMTQLLILKHIYKHESTCQFGGGPCAMWGLCFPRKENLFEISRKSSHFVMP